MKKSLSTFPKVLWYSQGELAEQQNNTAGAISLLIFTYVSIQSFYIVLENFKSKETWAEMWSFFPTLSKLFCCSILVKSSVESQVRGSTQIMQKKYIHWLAAT